MFRYLFILTMLICNLSFAEKSPNILLLISDDQRFDQTSYMPRVMKYIADKGISYNKAYIPTPLCCPSRAGIFTGQYNSRNKVLGNNFPLLGNTIFKDLDKSYYQGFVGKYLNSQNGSPLPEFEYWAVYPFGEVLYKRQKFNVNGTLQKFRGHVDLNTAKLGNNFLAQAFKQELPWFLTCAFFSPHSPAIADIRDVGRFSNQPIKRSPSFNLPAVGKPAYVSSEKFDKKANDVFAKKQRDAIYSMDRAINTILKKLKKHNQLENTIIIFLSDNGLMQGEHQLTSKVVPYEESIHIPMFIRYDAGIKDPKKFSHLVSNIDIAPTLYDLTKTIPNHQLDGVSLVPTFNADESVRSSLLIESWKNNWKHRESFYAIHTANEILINNDKDISEFYDMSADPYQITNAYNNPNFQERISILQEELNNLVIGTRGALDFSLPEATKVKTPNP